MDDYFEVKVLFFSFDYFKGWVIVNVDDFYGKQLIVRIELEKVWSYSVSDVVADLWILDLEYKFMGVKGMFYIFQGEIFFSLLLVGQYNLFNMLVAVGIILYLGLDLLMVVVQLLDFLGVFGWMERLQVIEGQDVSVIVDYVYIFDSLENLLKVV